MVQVDGQVRSSIDCFPVRNFHSALECKLNPSEQIKKRKARIVRIATDKLRILMRLDCTALLMRESESDDDQTWTCPFRLGTNPQLAHSHTGSGS